MTNKSWYTITPHQKRNNQEKMVYLSYGDTDFFDITFRLLQEDT